MWGGETSVRQRRDKVRRSLFEKAPRNQGVATSQIFAHIEKFFAHIRFSPLRKPVLEVRGTRYSSLLLPHSSLLPAGGDC